jgi:hypothetical protein
VGCGDVEGEDVGVEDADEVDAELLWRRRKGKLGRR